jgi:hypothetical protein
MCTYVAVASVDAASIADASIAAASVDAGIYKRYTIDAAVLCVHI